MRLEELVNQYYGQLNENDLMIWKYILSHKKECCSIFIEELSRKCNISRATISRFHRNFLNRFKIMNYN